MYIFHVKISKEFVGLGFAAFNIHTGAGLGQAV
jgi:hypothetical protein